MIARRRVGLALAAAVVAAVLASAGDLMMLWVANAARVERSLASPPSWVLPLGAALGVVAIPLYGLGYAALAAVLARPADSPTGAPGASPALVAALRWGGVATGLLGGAIHGATGWSIREALAAGAVAGPPLEAIVHDGGALLVAWAAEAGFLATASLALLRAGLESDRGPARTLLAANPFVVTLVLAGLAMPGEIGRSFLAPAAPNLAHVVLFAAALLARPGGNGYADPSATRS